MRIASYLKYLFQRKNAYALHSPFLFEFYNEVIKKAKRENCPKARTYLKESLSCEELIKREDFGAGSKVLGNEAKVSQIAKVAGVSHKYGKLLKRISSFYEFGSALELGTSVGIGSAYLLESEGMRLKTIEGCTETTNYAQKKLSKLFGDRVEVVHSKFEDLQFDSNEKFDLIYIDGNHRKAATIDFFNRFSSHLTENGLMVFDDIHWSDEMEEAWEVIKNEQIVTVSIDIYKFGIISLRKGQRKEHFVLKY